MITTERLLTRKPRLEDATDLAVAHADTEVVRFMGDGSTATIAEVEDGIRQWLERWESWGESLCSFELREDGRILGRAGFLLWDLETWEVPGDETKRDVVVGGKPGRLYSVER